MKKSLLALVVLVVVCLTATTANSCPNPAGKYSMYYGGPHDAKANTCDYVVTDCNSEVSYVVTPSCAGIDVYLVATDVNRIAGIRYGTRCEVSVGAGIYSCGWTSCSDFEIPSPGWPGCGENNAQTWTSEQLGPHVTLGIMDVYIYAGTIAKLGFGPDTRVGFAEMCDASPLPLCCRRFETHYTAFGMLGINRLGYNPCGMLCPAEQTTWGAVKAQYR